LARRTGELPAHRARPWALATLTDAASGSPTSAGVLEAANAVEILWDELKTS
jgi:hypothetical protein